MERMNVVNAKELQRENRRRESLNWDRIVIGMKSLAVVMMTLLVPAATIQLMGMPEAGASNGWVLGGAIASTLLSIILPWKGGRQ